jgi:Tfp pilus assembly PilM family ATPase
MKTFVDFFKRFQRGHTDVLGLDLATTGAKAVRLNKRNEVITVIAADILPALSIPPSTESKTEAVQPLHLPKHLRAKHVALAVTSPGAVVKLLSFPAHTDKSGDMQINELMGLGDAADYRVGYEPVGEHHPRAETRVLAVAMPEQQAQGLSFLFPYGAPAPCSIEVSGLASMTSFLRGPGREHADDCVAVVDFGSTTSLVAMFSKGVLVLVRKFDFGTSAILKRVQDNLGVDAETAQGILVDGSFDVSQVVHQTMEAFTQQLIISRDFVERRENCHIRKLYICGGTINLRDWLNEVRSVIGLETAFWNAFEGLTVPPGAVPEKLKGQESRFTAAVGAALAVLEN